MPEFITLTCPTCGGNLQITNDVDRFACGHCGNEHIVKRSGGIITIAPIIAEIKHVSVSVDKTASELAIVRLSKQIDEIEKLIVRQSKNNSDSKKMVSWGAVSIIVSLLLFASKSYEVAIFLIVLGIPLIISGIISNKNGRMNNEKYYVMLSKTITEKNKHLDKVRSTDH